MTTDEFIEALTARNERWRLCPGGFGRRVIRSGQTCPISCLAGMPANKVYQAAMKVGLAIDDAEKIIRAADQYWDYDTTLRQRIMKAVGLL